MATSTSFSELHPLSDTDAATAHDSRETNEVVNNILRPTWHVRFHLGAIILFLGDSAPEIKLCAKRLVQTDAHVIRVLRPVLKSGEGQLHA
jgi:hypothetical protein